MPHVVLKKLECIDPQETLGDEMYVNVNGHRLPATKDGEYVRMSGGSTFTFGPNKVGFNFDVHISVWEADWGFLNPDDQIGLEYNESIENYPGRPETISNNFLFEEQGVKYRLYWDYTDL